MSEQGQKANPIIIPRRCSVLCRPVSKGLRYVFVPINMANYHWVLVAYDIRNSPYRLRSDDEDNAR